MADNASTKVVTGKVRLSYVHVWEKYSPDPVKQEPKYSVTLLIPKSDTVTMDKINAALLAAYDKGKSKLGGKKFEQVKTTLKDGDTDADLERNPENAGCWYLTVSANTKPGIVDAQVEPILDQSEVYSGIYARVSMNAFAYDAGVNKGLSFGLNHIQKIADGEMLGGRTKASDDFDELDDADLL